MGLEYQWNDYWTTSPMEAKRNEYKDALKVIKKKLSTIEKLMDSLPDQLAQVFRGLNGQNVYDGSRGLFVGTFTDKVSTVHWQMEGLYNATYGTFANGHSLLVAKKNELERRLEILESLCKQEDRDQKELPLRKIPF